MVPTQKSCLHGITLRCYYRDHRTDDPLSRVGRQDSTAYVDFRALLLHGEAKGLECELCTGAGAFLRGMGALQELERLRAGARLSLDDDMETTALGALLDEHSLGGAFELMVQVKEGRAGW